MFSLRFFVGFLKNPLRNASVIPSSRFLARAMLDGLDFSKISSVVELGPGTGVFTREVLRRVAPGAKVVLVELNPDFARALAAEFGSRVAVENASAADLDAILAKHGVAAPGLIVCGLGLPSIPPAPRGEIMAAVARAGAAGSEFRMFSYVPGVIEKLFPSVALRRVAKVWRNFPPATVLALA